MKRHELLFQYSVKTVYEAVVARRSFHEDRFTYYDGQCAVTEDALREKGVVLEETMVTGGPQFQAKVDNAIADKLRLFRKRREFHEKALHEYTAWRDVLLSRKPEDVIELQHDDVLYFGVAGTPSEGA